MSTPQKGLNGMKHRFLLHRLSHTILIVDISEIGVTFEINARGDNTKMVPALRFPVWKEAEQYLRAKGADAEALSITSKGLNKMGVAALTIIYP